MFPELHSVAPTDVAVLGAISQWTAWAAFVWTLLTTPPALRWPFVVISMLPIYGWVIQKNCYKCGIQPIIMQNVGRHLWHSATAYHHSEHPCEISSWVSSWQSPGEPLSLELPVHGFLYAVTTERQIHIRQHEVFKGEIESSVSFIWGWNLSIQ